MITSLYPVLMCENLEATANFFIENFQFRETFRSDWYISLKNIESDFELAFIDSKHGTVPQAYQSKASGLIINIEVDNVDCLYEELRQQEEMEFLLPIKSEDFGQRHFIVEAPGSILVDIIQVIPPSEDFVANYLGGEDE
ncbi:VOC family protein [Streptococcus panodentis]|uniref:Glyoxalase n=1 Tax=Streptococcus panodentis TaxID=1581472 RepID=A0ABS5AWM0_9STRE|nr:VOC family protein [Streptococcus panodentis]MBP2620643.1 glyoxalase [Streptococcus panodentis]